MVEVNLNAKKETKTIEKNSLSSMASIKSVNIDSRILVDLKEEIKEKEVGSPFQHEPKQVQKLLEASSTQ